VHNHWYGEATDVPAMGSDGSDYTKGYMEVGSVPSFKILRGDELINLEGDIPAWGINQLYLVSSLTEAMSLPKSFSLDSAYPNPFNPVTMVSMSIPVEMEVHVTIHDILGREITELANGVYSTGNYELHWDAGNQASGIYFVKMSAGGQTNIQKLMLIK